MEIKIVPNLNQVLTAGGAATSAQLASVISDETGSGVLPFATAPILYTPTIVGWSNPVSKFYYSVIGKVLFISFSVTGGNGNSTTVSFTLPSGYLSVVESGFFQTLVMGGIQDNGVSPTTPGWATVGSNASVVNCYLNTSPAGTAWNAGTGARQMYGSVVIFIQ